VTTYSTEVYGGIGKREKNYPRREIVDKPQGIVNDNET
jgi:hypothetical protein